MKNLLYRIHEFNLFKDVIDTEQEKNPKELLHYNLIQQYLLSKCTKRNRRGNVQFIARLRRNAKIDQRLMRNTVSYL